MTPEEATNRITMFMTTGWGGLDVEPELEVLKIIQAQRSQAVEDYKASLWQPIETAPKDGTVIDLHNIAFRYPGCRWVENEVRPYWWQEDTQMAIYPEDQMTHWMPLPEPPKQKEDI